MDMTLEPIVNEVRNQARWYSTLRMFQMERAFSTMP